MPGLLPSINETNLRRGCCAGNAKFEVDRLASHNSQGRVASHYSQGRVSHRGLFRGDVSRFRRCQRRHEGRFCCVISSSASFLSPLVMLRLTTLLFILKNNFNPHYCNFEPKLHNPVSLPLNWWKTKPGKCVSSSCLFASLITCTGFPRGIESIEKVLNFEIGFQDLEKVLNQAKRFIKHWKSTEILNSAICLFKFCSLPLMTVL